MARNVFGARSADFVVQPTDGLWGVGSGAIVTFWDQDEGGTQYTDLLDAANQPITQVVADGVGFIPEFRGPDSVAGMWAEAGGGTSRVWMDARGGGGGSGGGGGFTALTRVVASATAPADVRAAAQYVCDGVADNVQIQQAIDDARDNGGGVVQLTVGDYALAAQLVIEGTDDVDVEIGIALLGQGSRATMLTAGAGLTSAIHLTKVVRVQLYDLGITMSGATHGLSSATTNGANSGHRSFWNSSFKNIQINGPWDGSHTGYALHLGSPFRSVFENIEVGGCGNGWRMFSEHANFNPGDCVISRSFVDIVGDDGVAYHIESPAGTMNQNNWSMCEGHAGGTGCTGILVDGSSQRFWGTNLEQFDTLVEVESGESNVFELNYVTCRDGGTTNKAFVCGTGSYNNRFSAMFLNVAAGDDLVAIQDASTVIAAPNIFERIRIEANAGTSTTYSAVASTIMRSIVAFLDGGTVQAGLLRHPSLGQPDPVLKSNDTSRANTVSPAADPHLSRPVAANAVYDVEVIAVWTNGGGGFRAGWSVPSGAAMAWTDNDGVGVTTVAGTVTFASGTGTTFKGKLITGATAGNVAFLWAQNTSNGSDTILRQGSALTLTRIA